MLGTSSSGDARVNLFREPRNRRSMILEKSESIFRKLACSGRAIEVLAAGA